MMKRYMTGLSLIELLISMVVLSIACSGLFLCLQAILPLLYNSERMLQASNMSEYYSSAMIYFDSKKDCQGLSDTSLAKIKPVLDHLCKTPKEPFIFSFEPEYWHALKTSQATVQIQWSQKDNTIQGVITLKDALKKQPYYQSRFDKALI